MPLKKPYLDPATIKRHLPTFSGFVERRKKTQRNRLPKHLRPPVVWPLYVHLALNSGLIVAMCTLMLNLDEYATDTGPAIAMGVCMLLLFYTVPSAFRLKTRYLQLRGRRRAKLNFWLAAAAFLLWPLTIVVFLP
jgi:hypothetical protein